MVNDVNQKAFPSMSDQAEREQKKFVQITQPLMQATPPSHKTTEEWLRPDHQNINSIRAQPFLKQIGQPQHTLLPIRPVIRNQ